MLSKTTENDTYFMPYQNLKNKFLTQLNDTVQHCEKKYLSTYNQERYFSVSYDPQIDSRIREINHQKEKITTEIGSFENCTSSDKSIYYLIEYAQNILNNPSKSLFIQVFKGKLNKHWKKHTYEFEHLINDIKVANETSYSRL